MKLRWDDMTSAENCQRVCQGIPGCKAWVFHATIPDCGIYSQDTPMEDKANKVAGVTECIRESNSATVHCSF